MVACWLTPSELPVKVSDVVSEVSVGKYPAEQSPISVQSVAGVVAMKRGIGSVCVAMETVDTGATIGLNVGCGTTAVQVVAGLTTQTGICAVSTTVGLLSTTSYTA